MALQKPCWEKKYPCPSAGNRGGGTIQAEWEALSHFTIFQVEVYVIREALLFS